MHRIQFWGEFLIFLIFLPLEIWHKLLCCHNFETIGNTCERGVFYYLVWSHDQVMQEQWEYYFLIPLKNSSEFLILVHFCKSCLQSWLLFVYNFILSFSSFEVTVQHDTMEMHGICLDSFKSSPRLLHFYVILK